MLKFNLDEFVDEAFVVFNDTPGWPLSSLFPFPLLFIFGRSTATWFVHNTECWESSGAFAFSLSAGSASCAVGFPTLISVWLPATTCTCIYHRLPKKVYLNCGWYCVQIWSLSHWSIHLRLSPLSSQQGCSQWLELLWQGYLSTFHCSQLDPQHFCQYPHFLKVFLVELRSGQYYALIGKPSHWIFLLLHLIVHQLVFRKCYFLEFSSVDLTSVWYYALIGRLAVQRSERFYDQMRFSPKSLVDWLSLSHFLLQPSQLFLLGCWGIVHCDSKICVFGSTALQLGQFYSIIAIWQKCPFSSAKKWHLERSSLRTDSKNLAKPPPKW